MQLRAEKLVKRYKNRVVVDHVSIYVEQGSRWITSRLSVELSKLYTEWSSRKETTRDELRLFHNIQ